MPNVKYYFSSDFGGFTTIFSYTTTSNSGSCFLNVQEPYKHQFCITIYIPQILVQQHFLLLMKQRNGFLAIRNSRTNVYTSYVQTYVYTKCSLFLPVEHILKIIFDSSWKSAIKSTMIINFIPIYYFTYVNTMYLLW